MSGARAALLALWLLGAPEALARRPLTEARVRARALELSGVLREAPFPIELKRYEGTVLQALAAPPLRRAYRRALERLPRRMRKRNPWLGLVRAVSPPAVLLEAPEEARFVVIEAAEPGDPENQVKIVFHPSSGDLGLLVFYERLGKPAVARVAGPDLDIRAILALLEARERALEKRRPRPPAPFPLAAELRAEVERELRAPVPARRR
jgi:hypothetical protein